jgi:hypothetical protein
MWFYKLGIVYGRLTKKAPLEPITVNRLPI